jgi:CubicO group peptidase (beta-lactamase class C family)
MFNARNPIRYILSKDILVTPGTVFEYSNCNSNLLGDIVRKASLERLDQFSENVLFSKIGVSDYEWALVSSDVVFASGDILLRPRDMAKFGQLFLDGGSRDGRQVISAEWVELSTRQHVPLSAGSADMWEDAYGYHWWRWESIFGVEFVAYMAQGWGGQWIIVWPQGNMVIVTTGGNYYSDPPVPIQVMVTDYILPAMN